ncbi:hypothetical protein HPP92_008662 [Vanilla planifolia]|uniref:UDP-glycosyltransferases domain-containing protein n=1 Tax=Vanilla planifolia TaxID=51239 RepID=A0A835V4P7_VANPL|nr:hypothetical protein HPP92_008662 [Vanilla planifolia]
MEPGSVIYVSFGSLARTPLFQLVEIGLGLEASNCPFVWVIKAGDQADEVDKWLASGDGDDRGFEERIRAKGLVIRGWAPQSMILEHPAVGGFMTHCGWNSTIEAVVAGVPMATWPHFAEQFVNEKLVVEKLRIGVVVGAKRSVGWREVQDKLTVGRGEVEKAVRCLMNRGEGQANGLRHRVKAMREKARRAMQPGGSSYYNLTDLLGI